MSGPAVIETLRGLAIIHNSNSWKILWYSRGLAALTSKQSWLIYKGNEILYAETRLTLSPFFLPSFLSLPPTSLLSPLWETRRSFASCKYHGLLYTQSICLLTNRIMPWDVVCVCLLIWSQVYIVLSSSLTSWTCNLFQLYQTMKWLATRKYDRRLGIQHKRPWDINERLLFSILMGYIMLQDMENILLANTLQKHPTTSAR